MSTMIEGLTLAPAEFQPKPQPVINVLLVTVKQASEALQVSEKTIRHRLATWYAHQLPKGHPLTE